MAMTIVDALLSRRPYTGPKIPDTPQVQAVRVMEKNEETYAWLEHKLLPKRNFHKVPPSEDPEVAASQSKENGVPTFRNKTSGLTHLILDVIFRSFIRDASAEAKAKPSLPRDGRIHHV